MLREPDQKYLELQRYVGWTEEDPRRVAAGRFREDLYYRINVLTIVLPPLRERKGNVRQLRNAIERAKLLAEEDELLAENLPTEILRSSREAPELPSGADSDLETINRYHIADTCRRFQGNKTRAARALGISRRTLYRLLEKYGIEAGEPKL